MGASHVCACEPRGAGAAARGTFGSGDFGVASCQVVPQRRAVPGVRLPMYVEASDWFDADGEMAAPESGSCALELPPGSPATSRGGAPPSWGGALTNPPIAKDTDVGQLHLLCQATLRSVVVAEAVKKPDGVGREVWITAMTFGLFEEIRTVVSLLVEVCDAGTCPTMAAGGGAASRDWADEERHPAPQGLCAAAYMVRLVSYAHTVLRDPSRFPVDRRSTPKNFFRNACMLHRRFLRVYVHAYLHHLDVLQEYDCEEQLHGSFERFLFFVREFELVRDADFTPLRSLVNMFLIKGGLLPLRAVQNCASSYGGSRETDHRGHGADIGIV